MSQRLTAITKRNIREHIRRYRCTHDPVHKGYIRKLVALMFRLNRPVHRVDDAWTIGS